jgi:hypothetical protein
LKNIDGMGLIEDGFIPANIVALNIDPLVGLKVIVCEYMSLPFCETVKGLEVLPWDDVLLKFNF